MSHQEKQLIFDEYAKSKGYEDFSEIISDYITLKRPSDILQHALSACDLVQEEQQKRIAESMNWDRCKNKGSECRTDKHENSILNP